ncbi:MAG TPA: hypothetical protein VGT03_06680 [Candidatus Acidoferrales bacterium]|nr:hypothetical protein [Candidatus Acidoferrales bacterium]
MKSMRSGSILILGLLCSLAGFCAAQQTQAPEAATVWNTIVNAPFDASKAVNVDGLSIVRDRIHITLTDGSLEFSQPAGGVMFGAAFKGRGKIEIAPPSPAEAQQLELFTKQKTLSLDFTDATFSFTDETFDDIARQVKWVSLTDTSLAKLYQDRQRAREGLAAEIVPRI